MTISRVTATWTGFSGAPGYTNFFFADDADTTTANTMVTATLSFFNTLRSMFPTGVTISVSPEVAQIDEASGTLEGFVYADDPAFAVTGSGAGTYSAPTGAVVNWRTEQVNRGRRVRGRTFLVPLSGGSFQADGTISNTALADLRDAASDLITAAAGVPLVVWSRPRNGAGGVAAIVTSSSVPDMAAVLRSRRD